MRTRMNISKFLIYFLFVLAVFPQAQRAIATESKDAEFKKLQKELDSQYAKEKVVGRFEKDGLNGLTPEDISLTLLSYSYHYTDDSGRPQAFVIAKCSINISKFEKEAEEIRKQLPANGPRIRIALPDSTRTLIGTLDVENHKLVTLASPLSSVKPVVKFVKLRKDSPEYILITGEEKEGCTDCDPMMEMEVGIVGFDKTDKAYKYVFTAKVYERMDADGADGGISYVDRSEVSWSDWINNEYRELIIKTNRKILRIEGRSSAGFKNRKEIYGWDNNKKLYMAERADDGKIVVSRNESLNLKEVKELNEELSSQPNEEAAIKLVRFIGDTNSAVALEAFRSFYSYKSRLEDLGKRPEKGVIHALIQKYLNGSPHASKEALLFISKDSIKDVDPEYKKLLLDAVDEKKPDFALLNLLSRASEPTIFHVLTNIMDKALTEKDGCKASGAIEGIKHFLELNVPFSMEQKTVLQRCSKSRLSCKGDAISGQANEILKALEIEEIKAGK